MRRTRTLTVFVALAGMLASLVIQAPARADVTELGWPYPPTNIDAYSARHGPVCDPTIKPGPQYLKDFLSFWNGHPHQFNPYWHIARPCASAGASSYHREGRALDFYVNYNEPRAQSIINFMLDSDEYGNPHARARRFGIIEIIWQNSIWSSDSPAWRHCGSCGGHFDHIHFSFSREGAHAQTSWYTTHDAAQTVNCPGGQVTVKYWNYPSGYGPLKHVRSITGAYGHYTDQWSLHHSPWRVYTQLGPSVVWADSPVSALYGAQAYYSNCAITLF
jgi:hypothetical protein